MLNPSLRKLRRWWQIRTGQYDTPIDGETPFWIFSLCVNLILVAILARLLVPNSDYRKTLVVTGEQHETIDIADQQLSPDVTFEKFDIAELGNENDAPLEIEVNQEVAPVEFQIESPLSHDAGPPDASSLLSDSSFSVDHTQILSAVNTTGTANNAVTGATGAVDRLTQEILRSLETRPTTVVWLFDQSASLTRQREQIEGRIDRIYRELNLLQDANAVEFNKPDKQPLLTQVYGFGSSITPALKQPTADVQEIKSAIAAIDRDTSGIENVFNAVLRGVEDFSRFRRVSRSTNQPDRNIMLIVVCDEAGDDAHLADEAIQACEKYAIPVFVIGVPAPFGRAETKVKWVDPDPNFDQRPQLALVSQGPESLLPERIQLEFSGADVGDLEMIDSGFGPFQLTRLCYRTGGIYFAVHPNRRKGRVSFGETAVYSSDLRYFFDPVVMKKYQPDYVSAREYQRRLGDNQARLALVQAGAIPLTSQLEAPRVRFPKLDEASFVRQVNEAQRAAAVLQPRLDRLYQILKEGELDREKEASPRWQAGYDLAIGRVIAAHLRSKSYNEMLALAKTKLQFDDPDNNTWVLRSSEDFEATGSQNEKLAAKARRYLERVVEQHPETPWAMLARRELSTPFGWQWRETYTPPPPPPATRPANNNAANPRNPQPRPNQNPRPLRPIPKL